LFESYKKKACVVQCGVIRQNFKYIFCETIFNMTRLYNISNMIKHRIEHASFFPNVSLFSVTAEGCTESFALREFDLRALSKLIPFYEL